MALKSKVLTCNHSQLERELNQWLAENGDVNITHIVQSQSYNKLPQPTAQPRFIAARERMTALKGDPQAGVTLTIIYSTPAAAAVTADGADITADRTDIRI